MIKKKFTDDEMILGIRFSECPYPSYDKNGWKKKWIFGLLKKTCLRTLGVVL